MTDLPSTISFDLDALERPKSEVKPPFVAHIGGRNVTMLDPSELDWRDLILLDSPLEFLRLCLSTEDRKHVLGLGLPAWKFNQLLEAFYNHFELEDKMRDARRQAQLSGV